MASRSLNKVMLIGNLTREPELRYTTGGTPVVTFGLATNKSWKDQDGNVKEVAEFHNIVAWNKLAEICGQLLKKGTKVYVMGRLQTRDWTDNGGVKKYKTEIIIEDMILLTPKKDGEGSEDMDLDIEGQSESSAEEIPSEDIDLDDINLDDLGSSSK